MATQFQKTGKKVAEIRNLKRLAHNTIDRIVRLGIERNRLYELLASRIGCLPENAHFYNVFTVRDAQVRLEALVVIEAQLRGDRMHAPQDLLLALHDSRTSGYRLGRIEKTTEKRPDENVLPQDKQMEALKNLRALREQREAIKARVEALPWYKRILHKMGWNQL